MNRAGPVAPSVTSAWSVPWSCTTKCVFLTFGQISARRAEKSFPAISITCSGDADVSALTSNLSDLGLESDIARVVLSLPVLPDGALLHRRVLAGSTDRMRRPPTSHSSPAGCLRALASGATPTWLFHSRLLTPAARAR